MSRGPSYGYHTGRFRRWNASLAVCPPEMSNDPQWANVRHVRGSRAVEHGAGKARPVRFEGYGPGGCALLVDCLTEEQERTRVLLRGVFREHGGHLGARNSVAYLFDRVGLMRYPLQLSLERLTRTALSAGAEDVIAAEGAIEVLTDPEDFYAIRSRLRRQGLSELSAEVTERAALTAAVGGEAALDAMRLISALAALGEVCDVYSNAQLAPAPMT